MVEHRTITLYYADWCVWSRQFSEEWEKIKDFIDNIQIPGYEFAWYEYEEQDSGEIMEEQNIEGYPTIRFNLNGSIHDYQGGRKAEKILLELLFKT